MSADSPQPSSPPSLVDHVLQLYGDLLFDFCESVLWSPAGAQLAFRATLKKLRQSRQSDRFGDNERAWVLRIACDVLKDYSTKHRRKLTANEQLALDATSSVPARLKQFDVYFHRLDTEDQIVLLLRDKYGLPFGEISVAMSQPEGTLRVRRQQALRTLEEWFWDRT